MKLKLSVACLFLGSLLAQSAYVPDFVVKPNDVTVLMAADGKNPNGLRAWINDHRRLQVKSWPVGGTTTWEVEVAENGRYAVNVLLSHNVQTPLQVSLSSGNAVC